jgi:hypothetical protein
MFVEQDGINYRYFWNKYTYFTTFVEQMTNNACKKIL